MRAAYDGGLREQTPPTSRRGPSPSVGAARLLGSKPHIMQPVVVDAASEIAGLEPANGVGVPTATHHSPVFVPSVEAMHDAIRQVLATPQPAVAAERSSKPQGSPHRRSPKPNARQHSPVASPVDKQEATLGTTTDSITQAFQMMISFLAAVPRFVPNQSMEAVLSLERIVNHRGLVHTLLQDAMSEVSLLRKRLIDATAENKQLQSELARAQQEKHTAIDLGVAADGQMVQMCEELKKVHDAKKQLAAEFEKKLHYIVHKEAPITRTTAAEYRTAECARVERECDELRAQLAKREGWRVERGALLEAVARESRGREAASRQLVECEVRNATLAEQLQEAKEQKRVADEIHVAERVALSEELERWRKQRSNPRQTEIIRRCMSERAFHISAFQTWLKWFRAYEDTRRDKAVMENTAEQQLRHVGLEGRLLKAKEERAILLRQVTTLSKLADEQMLRLNQSAASQSHLSPTEKAKQPSQGHQEKRTQRSLSHSERNESAVEDPLTNRMLLALVEDPHGTEKAPTSLIDIARMEEESQKPKHKVHQDPQVQAIQAYHMLAMVLQGIKRRLRLESLRIPHLPLTERSTEPVPRVVFDWIQDVFAFLHHVMSVEDRLLKAKVKLAFMNVRLRPDVKRINAQLHFCSSDAAQTDVLQRQLRGYTEIQRAIKALKGHIEATAVALVSSTDPKKHDQIRLLTHTFEADVNTFMERVECNRKMQFQFELQLLKLRDDKAVLIERLLSGGDHASEARSSRPAGFSGQQGMRRTSMLNHSGAPTGEVPTSPGMTSAASPIRSPIAPTRKISIGDLLPTLRRFDSLASWSPDATSRPMTSETLQHVVAQDRSHAPLAVPPVESHAPSASASTQGSEGGDDEPNTADPELEFTATEEGLEHVRPNAKTDDRNDHVAPLRLTGNVPSTEEIARILERQAALKKPDLPKVPDPWAERCREGYRISSILRAGSDGKLDAKEFLRLTKSTSAITQGVRRSLDSELVSLNKAKARRKDAPLATVSAVSTENHSTSASASQPHGRCESASSVASTTATSAIPYRDNLVRPSVVSLSEHRLRVPSSESSDVISRLLPRHRAQ